MNLIERFREYVRERRLQARDAEFIETLLHEAAVYGLGRVSEETGGRFATGPERGRERT